MSHAKAGDTVRIHYTGTLSDGSTFDSSVGRDPLEFTLGSGQVIAGFDKAVDGMARGEKKTVEIPANEAYGEHDPRRVQSLPRTQVPEGTPLDIGTQLQITAHTGQAFMVTVSEVTDVEVVLDANHRLAGKELTFEIELVEIA